MSQRFDHVVSLPEGFRSPEMHEYGTALLNYIQESVSADPDGGGLLALKYSKEFQECMAKYGQDRTIWLTNTLLEISGSRTNSLTLTRVSHESVKEVQGSMPFVDTKISQTKDNADFHNPPSSEFLLTLILSRSTQDEIIGDLNEMFSARLERYGLKRARFWYHYQVGVEIGAALIRGLKKLATFGWLTEMLRRALG